MKSHREYEGDPLRRDDLDPNPFMQFGVWYDEAEAEDVFEPHAVILATAAAHGRPAARVVLMRGWSGAGFEFFTSYASRKGRELEENPQAELLFYWMELERQIRVRGSVEKLTDDENRAYFEARPRSSRLAAYASPQSRVVENRAALDGRYAEMDAKFKGNEPLDPPEGWGGYRVVPDAFEFWQGRPNRLHDRFEYRQVDDDWEIVRLAP